MHGPYMENLVFVQLACCSLPLELICVPDCFSVIIHQHMENAYPGSNILVVTLTNEQSKRVEAQSDQETLKEAMSVLRDMFGPTIPYATDILVPRWWNNRFQRGSYSNYPMISDNQLLQNIKGTHFFFCFLDTHTHVRNLRQFWFI